MTKTLNEEAFLASMYGDAEDSTEKNPNMARPEQAIMNMPMMSHAIRQMQREMSEMKRANEELKAVVRRLQNQLRGTNHVLRNAQGRIADLNTDLDGKIDRREF